MRILKKTIWPHQITLDPFKGDTDQRVIWLENKIPKDRWYVIGPNRYCFKTDQDATMFALRWS
jgi:hypothetical protein